MKLAVYLILILTSGGRGDSVAVFPSSFADKSDCEIVGAQWVAEAKHKASPKFVCLEVMEKRR